jgi:vanillate O-demethylase ferredoxin subunit
MQLVRSLWVTKGLPPENLRFETFASSGNFPTQKFTVHLPRFNTSIEVQKNETLLQALEKAEVQILSDCKKGECGLCQVDILEYTGQIDHRDLFFSDIEKSQNNKLCACVSRISNGSITIDTGFRE